jgi:uncharacterized membrane protein YbhN (UPF0104 family)
MTASGARPRWLLRTAVAIQLAALAWVVAALLNHPPELGAVLDARALASAAARGALAYAALGLVLATAWWWLVGAYAARPSWLDASAVWARSQFAKYLPGNVFHYLSRQLLGRALGVSHASLAASAVLELASTVLAAVLIGTYAATAVPGSGRRLGVLGFATALGALMVLAWPVLDRRLREWPVTGRLMRELPRVGASRMLGLVGPSVVMHAAFLSGTGAILYALVLATNPAGTVPATPVVAAYALAWLVGTLTPGAPGGLGIREAVLTLELAPLVGQPHAASLALALRAVTLGGDGLLAAVAWAVCRRARGARAAATERGGRTTPALR